MHSRMQVTFWNVQQLMDAKRELGPALRRNRAKAAAADAYASLATGGDAAQRPQVGSRCICSTAMRCSA
jgi:hypothetical protein